jgi:hypothetical protein
MTDSIGDSLASHDLCVEDLLDDDSYSQDDFENSREPLTIDEWRSLHGVTDLKIPAEELIF